ncbi:MAG: DUF2203 domain-containing protein [Planctomycetes bacterium]|nr:DUF2203 domain-containing protein [Planctomycetota bacterium]
MGPKVFTVREANGLIPRLEEILAEMDRVRDRVRKVKSKMDVLEMLWGEEVQSESCPDHREYRHYIEEVEGTKQGFDAISKKLADMEALLKSVDTGLVDFYGVIDGRLVFLCWKRGEKSIEYYHHLEEGFGGRREIAAEYKLDPE